MLKHRINELGQQYREGFYHRDDALRTMLQSQNQDIDAALRTMLDDLNQQSWATPLNKGLASTDTGEQGHAYSLLASVLVETIIRGDQFESIFDPLLSSPIKEPSPDTRCIRYLSAEKWLWMLDQKAVPLMSPNSFDDQYDCRVPVIVLENALHRFVNIIDAELYGHTWIEYVFAEWEYEQRRIRDRYRISCWNLLDEKTSNLMWGQYANNRTGVALVCPYHTLATATEEHGGSGLAGTEVEFLTNGLVSYDLSDSVTSPVFFKRPEFKDEREVRLVAHSLEGECVELPLDYLIEDLSIELPIDAPEHHKQAVLSTWKHLKNQLLDSR